MYFLKWEELKGKFIDIIVYQEFRNFLGTYNKTQQSLKHDT
jgi:hypothetical protein